MIAFRIVTYNIHKGIGGLDRRYRPERIIETLTRYQPDIVLMQEVDCMVPRSNCDNQVELFADVEARQVHVRVPGELEHDLRLTRARRGA